MISSSINTDSPNNNKNNTHNSKDFHFYSNNNHNKTNQNMHFMHNNNKINNRKDSDNLAPKTMDKQKKIIKHIRFRWSCWAN